MKREALRNLSLHWLFSDGNSFRSFDRFVVCNCLPSCISDAEPWVKLFHALQNLTIVTYYYTRVQTWNKNQSADLYLLEFRMRQSVDDRIPAAGSLGEKNGDFGNDRVDERRITPDTKNSVDHKRSPCNDPQRHVHDGHFGSAAFGRKLLLIRSASEGSDVHFLSLSTKRFFVIKDGSYDENVAADNDENLEGDGTGHRHDEAFVVHILSTFML